MKQNVTIPTRLFITILLNNRRTKLDLEDPLFTDEMEVPMEIAKLLQSLDEEEELIHVEYPGEFNKRANPIVYTKQAWVVSETLFIKQRVNQESSRAMCALRDEMRERLTQGVMYNTGLVRERALALANDMVFNKRVEAAKEFPDREGNTVDLSLLSDDVTVKVLYHSTRTDGTFHRGVS